MPDDEIPEDETEQAAELGRADPVLAQVYTQHYRSLGRLAALLVRDDPTAKRVVQDAFVAAQARRDRFTDPQDALACVRQAVVDRSRSVLRHRSGNGNPPQQAPPDPPAS